tara:strand:+ start:183 stop:794 length:612 start_codon:yes stop_codon:yes gene_type:complete
MELEKRLFTIILSCKKYEKRRILQDTSRVGDHMYFIGDPKLSSPLVKWRGSSGTVHLPCPDNYESLSLKTFMAVKWAVENKDFDLLLKTDDDVIFLDGFNKVVRDASQYDYSGDIKDGGYDSDWHTGKVENKKLNTRKFFIPPISYCQGCVYFLSKQAALILAKHELTNDYCIYEDAEVGNILWKSKIYPSQIDVEPGFEFYF